MYGIFIGLGYQNRSSFKTHCGKISLRWHTPSLGSACNDSIFQDLYLVSINTPLWNSIVQKSMYFSFLRTLFRSFALTGSDNHHICLLFLSVIHGLHKQCWHSSQFSFCEIRNVHSNSVSSMLLSASSWFTSFKSQSLKLKNWIIASFCTELTRNDITLVSSFSSIFNYEMAWEPLFVLEGNVFELGVLRYASQLITIIFLIF